MDGIQQAPQHVDPWQDYPSPVQLKKEVKAMAAAYVSALLSRVPKEAIAGVYWKGSSLKEWDSPIDYVPGVSDVDIHIRFKQRSLKSLFKDIPDAIAFSRDVERRYFETVERPLHVPGLQLKDLEEIERMPNYLPSPETAVKTLFGEEYGAFSSSEKRGLAKVRTDLLATKEYLLAVPVLLTDKQDVHIEKYLGEFDSKISPAGPGILCLWGMEYEEAWSMNRTRIVEHLRKKDAKLAAHYASFYRNAWKYFVTHDVECVRDAILDGTYVLEYAVRLAES